MFLNEETKIHVQRQRPKASWAKIDGRRSITTLENKAVNIPLRLEGEGPWTISYRNMNTSAASVATVTRERTNDIIAVKERGTYELLSIHDKLCPGTIVGTENVFEVDWLPRPQVSVSSSSSLEELGGKYKKKDVCEGDLDSLELKLSGMLIYIQSIKQRHNANLSRFATLPFEVPPTAQTHQGFPLNQFQDS
jgi:nucleoporin POM152